MKVDIEKIERTTKALNELAESARAATAAIEKLGETLNKDEVVSTVGFVADRFFILETGTWGNPIRFDKNGTQQ